LRGDAVADFAHGVLDQPEIVREGHLRQPGAILHAEQVAAGLAGAVFHRPQRALDVDDLVEHVLQLVLDGVLLLRGEQRRGVVDVGAGQRLVAVGAQPFGLEHHVALDRPLLEHLAEAQQLPTAQLVDAARNQELMGVPLHGLVVAGLADPLGHLIHLEERLILDQRRMVTSQQPCERAAVAHHARGEVECMQHAPIRIVGTQPGRGLRDPIHDVRQQTAQSRARALSRQALHRQSHSPLLHVETPHSDDAVAGKEAHGGHEALDVHPRA
jgi:hypothetical protein